MILNNIYIFVKNKYIKDCIKYGMKLTVYSDITFKKNSLTKQGIIGYFTPKDNIDKYNNNEYTILRIKIDKDIYKYIYILDLEYNKIISVEDYNLGLFKLPIIIISTSILQERIFNYNKILDVPLLITTSQEIYYDIKENERIEKESYLKSILL